ncbi:hypothetical protein [Pseudoalteromonas luteoviolacea]|uniref:Uncharacterized protein n=1 Tax=Pseudoalteromonas luteoviolacea H33 TaxID=1365251 RepID=A0A167B3X2_9GAMM|nr:hypothetical protein [Pseudoalteromonas luteoviolacea]KZN46130.1 hypothetical protein N476_03140 [Pseudoalteromonas luteoviolacea H33]KZN75215.1 hypothetical protein N477_20255 [Pseudoalteromonas luteoviolacea H33-S]MBQ4875770.1 hypothetical protein [Pseudoalteromonas luteoviolacea]MBQ4904805.1 hypothetical protein [Pseudoalteromonas luteoviolacea]
MSDEQHDPFYIEGYIIGLGLTPQTVLPSLWITKLLGEENTDLTLRYSALLRFYHACMDRVLRGDFSLPEECNLTKDRLGQDLLADKPLPNYCSGMLQALSFIENIALSDKQRHQLGELTKKLMGFKSYLSAQSVFSACDDFADSVIFAFQNLESCISKTAYEMRFSKECIAEADELSTQPSFDRNKIESHLNDILSSDSPSTLKFIHELITVIERELITASFIEQYASELECLDEVQPYLILKARKAQVHYNLDDFESAKIELETLLQLAPSDYYNNRYQLCNCYIRQKDWEAVNRVLSKFGKDDFAASATRLLCNYAQHGNNPVSIALKQDTKRLFPEIINLAVSSTLSDSSHGSGAFKEYINKGGLKAWRSVEGSLFWLKADEK